MGRTWRVSAALASVLVVAALIAPAGAVSYQAASSASGEPPVLGAGFAVSAEWMAAGVARIDWDEVADAVGYEVMALHSGRWSLLSPNRLVDGAGIEFEGSSAVVWGLRAESTVYSFAVRARNGAGVSLWSASVTVDVPEPRAAEAGLFDPFTAPTRSGIDLERLATAVETINTAADCSTVPSLSVSGVDVVTPPANLNDPDATLTVAEVTRVAGGCMLVEYVLLNGRSVTEVRELLAGEASVHAVGEPPRGVVPAHPDTHAAHTDPHHDDGGGRQWHLPQPAMTQLWQGWIGDGDPTDGDSDDGRQIVVAVLDTGVDTTHADLDDRVVSSLGGCHDTDQHGHGTHVAGIIAAEHDASAGATNQHVAGVAPKASIIPIRVLATDDCPTGTTGLSVTQGVAAAINAGAQVINMSLSRTSGSSETVELGEIELPGNGVSGDTLELVLRAASMRGIVNVAAVGNCGRPPPLDDKSICGGIQHREFFPSLYEQDVISVAAINSDGDRSGFSNVNQLVDIAAPGGSILSTFPVAAEQPGMPAGTRTCTSLNPTRQCTLGTSSGTSMAASFVSGVVAHMLNRYPQATPGQVREALQSSAWQPTGTTGRNDELGWGIVDPAAAVSRLGGLLDGLVVEPSDQAGGFVSVVASGENSCALRVSGAVECWGDDTHGRSMPPQVKYRSIEASQDFSTPGTGGHACGILDDGIASSDGRGLARCWGLGTTSSALEYSARGAFSQISVGNLFTCGLRPDTAAPADSGPRSGGNVVCWMHPPTRRPFSDGRHLVPADARFMQLSLGWVHGCGVKPDGYVDCWGRDFDGETDHSSVSATLLGGFTQVASGRYHSCALRHSGTAVCWGESRRNAADVTGATQPPAGVKFTSLTAHRDITCGLRTDSGISCWGDDTYGQVSDTPTSTGFIGVDAGDDHVCAVRSTTAAPPGSPASGYVMCWGRDDLGQVTPPLAGKLTSLQVSCPTGTCASGPDLVASFDPATTAYYAPFAPDAAYVTVTAESMPYTTPPGTVSIGPADSRPALDGHQVDITAGQPITITVTSTSPYDDTAETAYTVTLPRPDAALEELAVHAVTCDIDCTVGAQVSLSPAFDTGTRAYQATVDSGTDLIEISYSASAAETHVQVTPADSSPTADGHQIRLPAGQTTRVTLVATVVKSELPSAPVSQVTYTIDITRP